MSKLSIAVVLAAASALFALAPASVGAQTANAQSTATDWRAQGPRALVLTYKVAPAARLSFRAAVRASTLPRLQRLKATGALDSYHVLASRYLDGPWDLMFVLNFRRPEDVAHWREVEARTPGGLSPSALRLVSEAEGAPSDRMRHASPPTGSRHRPVYMVVPYEYTVSTDEYLTYVDAYVLPQVEGWMKEGVLLGYDLYFARYYAGRPWTSMLVLAYDGDEGLAKRDQAVQAVRERLAGQPEWKKIADGKHAVRVEKEAMIADELSPPAE